jgi:hypothetical protein
MDRWPPRAPSRPPHRELERRPDVAISIDTDDQPPLALRLRGRARIEHINGIVAEYRLAAERYLGTDAGHQYLADLDQDAVSMARITVRPDWVGLFNFADSSSDPTHRCSRVRRGRDR